MDSYFFDSPQNPLSPHNPNSLSKSSKPLIFIEFLDNRSLLMSDFKFVDLFRKFHPNEQKAFTCWNTQLSARTTNFGTRIDFAIADERLSRSGLVTDVEHLTNFFGSDHCPILTVLDGEKIEFLPGKILPHLSSSLLPRLAGGVQKKLTSFYSKGAFL